MKQVIQFATLVIYCLATFAGYSQYNDFVVNTDNDTLLGNLSLHSSSSGGVISRIEIRDNDGKILKTMMANEWHYFHYHGEDVYIIKAKFDNTRFISAALLHESRNAYLFRVWNEEVKDVENYEYILLNLEHEDIAFHLNKEELNSKKANKIILKHFRNCPTVDEKARDRYYEIEIDRLKELIDDFAGCLESDLAKVD